MRDAGLSKQIAVILDRRGLRALLAREVVEPLRRELAHGGAELSPLSPRMLDLALGGVVLCDELRRSHGRALLVEIAVGHATAASSPAAVARPLEPRQADPSLDLGAAAAPLHLVERMAFDIHSHH